MQTITKAVEIAQVQLLVKVVDMLVVVHIQAPVRMIRRTVDSTTAAPGQGCEHARCVATPGAHGSQGTANL